jgi:hypothetical protein
MPSPFRSSTASESAPLPGKSIQRLCLKSREPNRPCRFQLALAYSNISGLRNHSLGSHPRRLAGRVFGRDGGYLPYRVQPLYPFFQR